MNERGSANGKEVGNEGIVAKGKERKGEQKRKKTTLRRFPIVSGSGSSSPERNFLFRWESREARTAGCTAISCIVHGQLERNKGGTSSRCFGRAENAGSTVWKSLAAV